MTRIETKEHLLAKIMKAQSELASREERPGTQHRERTSPADHYYISKYAKASYDLAEWLSGLEDDPAVAVRSILLSVVTFTELNTRISFCD